LKKELHIRDKKRGLVYQLRKIMHHFFPDLFIWLREIEDFRRKSEYELAELITACIAMYLFKNDSRNAFNNLRKEAKFKINYERLFNLKLPHPDTVENILRRLPNDVLEQLKDKMIAALLDKKSLHKYRYQGQWFTVAIDGTGVVSFDEKHCEQCLHSTSKKGKTSYFHTVLEAKLVTSNGFAISLATEWIENPLTEYDKQDCERKAFTRLSDKIKEKYPRLPICLLADGLYPYQGFFETCDINNWVFIATFKDGLLPSVWKKIEELLPLLPDNQIGEKIRQGKHQTNRHYRWINNIDYSGYKLNWIECVEIIETNADEVGNKFKQTRFSQITNIIPCNETIIDLITTGRMRWKIENEGFNQQKNGGYKMQHKFARKSYRAMKNYYQCLQIANMINQLMILSTEFQSQLKSKTSIKHLWWCMKGELIWGEIDQFINSVVKICKTQVRFIS